MKQLSKYVPTSPRIRKVRKVRHTFNYEVRRKRGVTGRQRGGAV